MRTSIKYLPEEKQEDLKYLVKMILEKIPQTEMVILYGSYATGKYVEYDIRNEFGILTTFMSDYDILVVTHKTKDKEVGQKLDNIEDTYYRNNDKKPPVQFINDSIEKLNRNLSDSRYFYTQIKKEGVFLYDSGKFKLARRRKLHYPEIKKQSEDYFHEKHKRAYLFYEQALFMYEKKEYTMSSFNLHQTCENLFHAIRLTFTLENGKQHNLTKLLSSVKKYSDEFDRIFPVKTKEEIRLFNLLKAAYVEARYNPDFKVNKQDIDALIPVIRKLFGLVEKLCENRISEYEAEVTKTQHIVSSKPQPAAATSEKKYKTKKKKTTSR